MLAKNKPVIKIFGSGKPHVAVVACLHGDEKFGKRILKNLSKQQRFFGTLTLITAHPEAIRKNKRFIKKDLNRSFPGSRSGVLEEQIARHLLPVIKKQDLVVDLHATKSDFSRVGIVTKNSSMIRHLLHAAHLPKVIFVDTKKFGKGALIDYCKVGISLEYGKKFLLKNPDMPVRDVNALLRYSGLLPQTVKGKKREVKTELFELCGIFKVPGDFRPNKERKEFELVKRGEIVGHSGGSSIEAKQAFFPAFMGKGKYEGVFALMLKKKKWTL